MAQALSWGLCRVASSKQASCPEPLNWVLVPLLQLACRPTWLLTSSSHLLAGPLQLCHLPVPVHTWPERCATLQILTWACVQAHVLTARTRLLCVHVSVLRVQGRRCHRCVGVLPWSGPNVWQHAACYDRRHQQHRHIRCVVSWHCPCQYVS